MIIGITSGLTGKGNPDEFVTETEVATEANPSRNSTWPPNFPWKFGFPVKSVISRENLDPPGNVWISPGNFGFPVKSWSSPRKIVISQGVLDFPVHT